jgi:HSP20 family protein
MLEHFFPALRKSDPAGRFPTPFEAMERLMREPFPGFSGQTGVIPSVDVTENETQVLVNAELPGIDPKDVELTLENGVLTIRGQKHEKSERKDGETLLSREIRYGSFSRSLTLPAGVQADKATASFEQGVLKIAVPKAEDAKPMRVRIEG